MRWQGKGTRDDEESEASILIQRSLGQPRNMWLEKRRRIVYRAVATVVGVRPGMVNYSVCTICTAESAALSARDAAAGSRKKHNGRCVESEQDDTVDTGSLVAR